MRSGRKVGYLETLESRQLLALTIANAPAQSIAAHSAEVGAELIEIGNSEPAVSIYWGDNDGGTDLRLWDQVINLGSRPVGSHYTTLSNLTAGTQYFYRSFAFSFSEGAQVWADSTATFTTLSLPTVSVQLETPTIVGDSSAVVQGTVGENDSLQSVKLFFGTVDGGEDEDGWERSLSLAAASGDFLNLIAGLSPNTQYFARLAATNLGGTAWTDSVTFTTADVLPLRISEIMSNNASTLPTRIRLSPEDRFAGPKNSYDWIEIQNATAEDKDISGYALSDSADDLTKWQFPNGTVIPAESSIVVLASSLNVNDPRLDEQQMMHTNFSLARDGEPVFLVAPDGTIVHQLEVGQVSAGVDISKGFFGNSFGSLRLPTPGTANQPVSNEIRVPEHRFLMDSVDSPLIVTTEVLGPAVDHVTLVYRSMFEAEQVLPMVDDGTNGDEIADDNIYTAIIPGGTSAPGEMIRYYVTAEDQTGVKSRLPRFLSPSNSPEYFGTMVSDPSIQSNLPVLHRFIESERRAETGSGTRASVFFDGEFYDNVFIRIRGGTARSWPKKAYKIEFNDQYDFRYSDELPRVDEINLNTTYTDKSYVRAVLSYELYRDSGGIAPITFPIRVEQNGEFWNLAHFVEQPDRDYLRHNGLDPNGALYKARADRLNGLVGRAQGFFDKKTRHAEDASDLQGLIDGLRLKGAELENFLFDNVDLPAQINLMAVNVILQNLDATDKNYYIYRDTEGNGEWKMLPWDLDLVLGPNALNTDVFSAADDDPPGHTSHPYMGTLAYPYHGRKNHLFDAIVNSPQTNAMFLRRLRTLMDSFLASEDTPLEERYFENRIDQLVELIRPDVLLDREKWGRNAHFPGRVYTVEEAAERIKNEYLVPRRVHLFQTHSIDRLAVTDITTIVPESSVVSYFVPTDNSLGTTWTGRGEPANIADWQTGPMGLGFENTPDDFDELIKTRVAPLESCDDCTSIYLRVPFSLDDPSAIEKLSLRLRFDDGFVAYINGVEVLRENIRGDEPSFDSRSQSHPNREAVKFQNYDISSLIPNIDLSTDNVLAVHAVNSSKRSSDMLISLELVEGVLPNEDAVGIPNRQTNQPNVAFTRIEANPASGNQDEEFIEIHNASDEAVDISGWSLTGGVEHTFRGGTVIPPNASLFATPNAFAFRNRSIAPRGGMGLLVQDGYRGHLSNRGEIVQLVDRTGVVVSTVTTPNNESDPQRYLRVTELMYNPAGPDESTEFIELKNISSETTIDLTGVRITDGPSSPFDFSSSSVKTLGPGEYVLVVNDIEAFSRAYPSVNRERIAGEFTGSLANGGEQIKIEDADNATILDFRYEDGRDENEPWPVEADGEGYSLVVVNEYATPDQWNLPSQWKASKEIGGSPGGPDSSVDADFDNDGDIDATDIDLLSEAVRTENNAFDLNGDGVIDGQDREFLIYNVLGTTIGDSNLDGVFNSTDFVFVFRAGEYEDTVPSNSGWAEGDWDGDGDFTTSDLVAAFQFGDYVRAAVASTPRSLDLTDRWFDKDKLRHKRERAVDAAFLTGL